MQSTKDFITANGGLIATVAGTIACFNVLISFVQKCLELIDTTDEKKLADPKYQTVLKIQSKVQTILDWLTSNRAH